MEWTEFYNHMVRCNNDYDFYNHELSLYLNCKIEGIVYNIALHQRLRVSGYRE